MTYYYQMDQANTPITNQQSPVTDYKLSRYRYINLILFILAAAVNTLPIQTYASINSLIQDRFDYTPIVITFNVLLGPIMHPFMATPCNMILDRFGVRVGCTIGGILVILGSWARTFMVVGNPFWAFAGSVLYAAGNAFVLSSPSAFAIKWFPHQSVPKVIAVTVLFNLLSGGAGASVAGLILPQTATVEEIKHFLIIQAIIITIPFILFIIFFRQAPQHPPSKAAANKNTQRKQPYMETVKNLVRNRSYLKIILSMSFSYGIFISFISILDQSLATLGYENPGQATSTTIGSAMLMGTFSAFMFTRAIRKTLKYKLIISLCLLGAAITFTLLELAFCFKIQIISVIVVLGACVGFFVIPLTALFTTYSAELTYPVGQGSATGYLFAGSQTVGFISGMVWVSILDRSDKQKVYWMFIAHSAFIVLALIVNLNTAENLNKTKYQLSDELGDQAYDSQLTMPEK